MRDHGSLGMDIDMATVSEKMALGAIIATCRDWAAGLNLSFLASLLERAALAVDEDLAKVEPLRGAIDHRQPQ